MSSVYDTAADMAHRADELSIMLLRERSHELNRIGNVLRDLHLAIVQGLSALSDETRQKIASNQMGVNGMWSLLEAAAKFNQFGKNMEYAAEGILTDWAIKVRDAAKESIGTYKYKWPELGPAVTSILVIA
jgi:hypothetical protein